jgi:small multidrug resistance pump
MGYVYLSIAIVAEVVATSALKAADGFSKPGPSVVVVLGYALAFYVLSFVFRAIPMGVAYAIWSGVGIALISLAGAVIYRQALDAPAVIGIAMIIGGVAIINLFSKATV